MAIAYLGSASASGENVSSVTVTNDMSAGAGDVIVFCAYTDANRKDTFTPDSGLEISGIVIEDYLNGTIVVYYKKLTGSDVDWTINWTTNTNVVAYVFAFSWVNGTTPIDTDWYNSADNWQSTTNYTLPDSSQNYNNSAVVAFAAYNSSQGDKGDITLSDNNGNVTITNVGNIGNPGKSIPKMQGGYCVTSGQPVIGVDAATTGSVDGIVGALFLKEGATPFTYTVINSYTVSST